MNEIRITAWDFLTDISAKHDTCKRTSGRIDASAEWYGSRGIAENDVEGAWHTCGAPVARWRKDKVNDECVANSMLTICVHFCASYVAFNFRP